MTPKDIVSALEGHAPEGDFNGDVYQCGCGWDGSDLGGDYRDHVADILGGTDGDSS